MEEPTQPREIPGSEEFDPLSPKRQFSWKVFIVAGAIIIAAVVLHEGLADAGYGIAMGICAVIAIAIAAPSAFSETWAKDTMPEVNTILDRADAGKAPQPDDRNSGHGAA